MNIIEFISLHGCQMCALRHDWELIFGARFEITLFDGKAEFSEGRKVKHILDPQRLGELCEVDYAAGTFYNPDFAEAPTEFKDDSDLEPFRLTTKSFCRAVAHALGIKATSVSVTNEEGRLHALRVSPPSVYLSMARTTSELKAHVETLGKGAGMKWILTLRDFSTKLPQGIPTTVKVLPLAHYIDDTSDCRVLRQPEGVDFTEDCQGEQSFHRQEMAVLKRPADATYGQLKVILVTSNNSPHALPEDDLLLCSYRGQKPVPVPVKNIPGFWRKTFNVEWELFRRYAIGGGTIPYAGTKAKASRLSTRRGRLAKILNEIFDMPAGRKPFKQGSVKGSETSFSLEVKLRTHSPDLTNQYSTVRTQE